MTQPTPSPPSAGDVPLNTPGARGLSADEQELSPAHPRKRADLAIPVAVYEINGCIIGDAMSCVCTDFSKAGFRIRCRKVMYTGQVLAMILPQKTGGPKVFFGTIREVHGADSGRYDLGVQLGAVPDYPAVRSWARQQSSGRTAA